MRNVTKRPSIRTLLLAALVALAATPGTDLAPPGAKTVATQLVFEIAAPIAGQRFAVRPGGGLREITPGTPIGLTSLPRVTVYALAAGETLPAAGDWHPPLTETWPIAHPRADLPVRRAAAVSIASPIARVVHRIRLTGVDGDVVQFELLGTDTLDAHGNRIDGSMLTIVWLALAAIGALGLADLARRRRTRGAEA